VKKRDLTEITYKYDGTGQRIYKKVSTTTVTKETHYVRDGSGNVLAIYENKILDELVIYGSSRLGSYNGKTTQGKRTLGNKKYKLSNHLGNVLSVISDNKLGIDNVGGDFIADYYEPLVISESDYYPFGMAMKERSFSNEEYRFGFNTQEKSTEIGEDTYTAEFWQYDSRTARRWNVDPVVKPHESSYAAFGNNPIWFVDINGADSTTYITNDAGEEYDKEALEATAENAQKIANVNGANFVTFKAISREELLEKMKEGGINLETDAIYIYSKSQTGPLGRTVANLGYNIEGAFEGVVGGIVYIEELKKNDYINKDAAGNYVNKSIYFHAGLVLAHETFTHAYPILIEKKLISTKKTKTGEIYGRDLSVSNSLMYGLGKKNNATILTESIINQNYTLSNTYIVENISNYFAYIHHSKQANRDILLIILQGDSNPFQTLKHINELKNNAKSNIIPLVERKD